MPPKKEIHFFGSDLRVLDRPKRTMQEYLAYFSGALDEKRIGEASVWYLYSKQAAFEIQEFCPSASIIVMLRNPVDMIYALHSQQLCYGKDDIGDFAAALVAEEDRKRGLRIPAHRSTAGDLFYRDAAQYTSQVERYLRVFGQKHVHTIIFDDLERDPARVFAQTCEFLDVSTDFRPRLRVVNPNKRVRSRAVLRFLKSPPPGARRLAKALLPAPFRTDLRHAVQRLNIKYEPRAPMDPGLRRHLQAEFLPEIERLSELLGRDLSHWCRFASHS
jgi:hypothetical protein